MKMNYEEGGILQLKDFDFYLPEELIAQHPAEKRDECRLISCGQRKW